MIDPEKYKHFREIVSTTNQLNGCQYPYPVEYIFLHNRDVTFKTHLSLYDLTQFNYIIVLGQHDWQQGSYTNTSANLIGLFDSDFNLVKKIPITERVVLLDIKFKTSGSSFYNAFKPILAVEVDGVIQEIQNEKDLAWEKEFPALFQKLYSL